MTNPHMPDTCYFCDSPATSREHVPPACLFPERKDLPDGIDYRKNLITVPSCDAHNSNKSRNDEYLQLILIHGYFNSGAGRGHFNSKVIRALTRRPAILAALYANQKPVTVDTEPTIAVCIDRHRFNTALKCVCQGLCVYTTGSRWPKGIEIYTPMLLSMNEPNSDKVNALIAKLSKAVIAYLSGVPKRGDNPDIFWYQLLVNEQEERFLCRMTFYGGFDVFVVFDPRLGRESVV